MQSLEELRKTIILSPTEDLANRRKPHLPSDDNPNYTYGLATKYSVPVGKLISYHYQREWENMIIEGIYEKKKKEYEEKMKNAAKEQKDDIICTDLEGKEITEENVNITENASTSNNPKVIHKCHCNDLVNKVKELESEGIHPCACNRY